MLKHHSGSPPFVLSFSSAYNFTFLCNFLYYLFIVLSLKLLILAKTYSLEYRKIALYLKCYCDENLVFPFPVFLTLISHLDPKFLESVHFFTSQPLNSQKQASENRKIASAIARMTNLKSPRNHYSGFLCDVIVTTRDRVK